MEIDADELNEAMHNDVVVNGLMKLAEHVRGQDDGLFMELGASDKRSFLVGMFVGMAVGMEAPYDLVVAMVKHETIQAMLDGATSGS